MEISQSFIELPSSDSGIPTTVEFDAFTISLISAKLVSAIFRQIFIFHQIIALQKL